jgi:hypothetical protein
MTTCTERLPPLQLGAAASPANFGVEESEHKVAPTILADKVIFPPIPKSFAGDAAKAATVGGFVGITNGRWRTAAVELLTDAALAAS